MEDSPESIRQAVWLATDRVYRSASQRLIQIKADEKLRAAATDGSNDFSEEAPQVFFQQPPAAQIQCRHGMGRAPAQTFGAIHQVSGSVEFQHHTASRAVDGNAGGPRPEGTRLEHGRLFSRIIITAAGKAADGMDLQTMESFETDDPARLPKDAEILAAVEKAGKNFKAGLC